MTFSRILLSSNRPEEEFEILTDVDEAPSHHLVVHNDDVNTFDFVIESLMKVCRHSRLQAEQCSIIIHYKGKCSVKEGEFDELRPMCEALLDRGITATID
ncbi:MAG: ATP-dependent Clp protease adaptor ClpS [Bacteroidota bacterium]|jgi:ATP-dependent Clp protease adaptor protein ClpS